MKECPCTTCSSTQAYVYRSGSVMCGGYGSAQYDTTWLAITGDDLLEKIEALCDGCTKELEEQGKLFAYMSTLGDVEPKRLPAEAYEAIFAHQALAVMRTIETKVAGQILRGSRPSMDEVETLRSELEYDPSKTTAFRTSQVMYAEETLRVAKAHILAAYALGVEVDRDHIESAAKRYGERLTSTLECLDKMFEQMSSELT